MSEGYRSGFVALVGRPNVGKSTLLNALVGEKVAIVAEKPQTTRNRIHGILTDETRQIIFIDTPGIHKPRTRLGDYMVGVARRALAEVDVVLYVVDGRAPLGPGDQEIAAFLRNCKTPVLLAVNKVDALNREETVVALDRYSSLADFAEVVPISALTGERLDVLLEIITKYLPSGPQFYPADMVTDQPERFAVAELVREQVLKLTRDEVPHAVAVDVEEMEQREGKDLVYVRANIYVEKESQKRILIGRDGAMLKAIGQGARSSVEALLGMRVFLDLWVKVKKDWRDTEGTLRELGFER
ncbi:MAG: GTPase Era [Firmicutes bacterium]|jgi:GTP-binding protein Era|nr:GTPase Era [Bacillota bacterium]